MCQVSGSRAVNSKGCHDSEEMTNANRMERTWHHQKRKLRERNVREKRRPDKQQATGRAVRPNGIKRKWHHHASSNKMSRVERKEMSSRRSSKN